VSEATPIDGGRLFEFVGSAEWAVLLVSAHRWQRFSPALGREMRRDHPEAALGTVDLTDLLVRGGNGLRFLHQGFYECGAPSVLGVLPGYCLFLRGRMLAWDAGLPAVDDVAAIARSALLGAVWSGVTRDVAFVGHALHMAADQASGERVAARFRVVAAAGQGARAPNAAPPPPREDVYWAYQVLGVGPTATDREVHEAWRRRQKESHPDHAAGDPAEFARRTKLSAEINRARDIIMEFRASGPRRAS